MGTNVAGLFEEFRKFAMRGNVMDLAVGVVVGAAFTGGLDFSNLFLVLKGAHPATLKAAQDAGAVTINYGLFINAIINFLVVAMALFIIIRWINRLTTPKTPAEAAPAVTPEDTILLREIRDSLKSRS